MPRLTSFSLLALTSAAVLAGCGGASDDLPRQPISGRVTLDGQPIEAGTIQFMPTGGGTGPAVGGGSMIEAGAYAIPREQGLIPGTYRVNIFSPEAPAGAAEVPGAAPGESPGKPARERERVPARYNAKSTLTAEVAAGEENTFDFELTTKR